MHSGVLIAALKVQSREKDEREILVVTFIASTSTYGLSFSTVSPSCWRNLTILPVTSERSSEGL